jgi:hypothetical protein
MANMEILKSSHGKDILIYNHASLLFDKNGSGGNKIWKCSDFAKKKCVFRLHTNQVDGGMLNIVKVVKDHNHVVTR